MSKVLIVENHQGLKSTLSKLLKGMGIESEEASCCDKDKINKDINLVITGSTLIETDIPTISLSSMKQPLEVNELCDTIKNLIGE